MKNDRQRIVLDLAKAGVAKAMGMVEETKVVLANAEKDLDRVKIAANALPRKELEGREDQVLRLKANLNSQMGDLAQAREEVRLREQELRETQLMAPFSGTVTEIFVNRGDSLKPMETQVLELVALDTLYVEVLLPSSYIQKVGSDQRIRIQVESEWLGRQGDIEGRVIFINPTADASSRTFGVKIGIPRSNPSVRPGLLVQALRIRLCEGAAPTRRLPLHDDFPLLSCCRLSFTPGFAEKLLGSCASRTLTTSSLLHINR